MKVFPHLMFAVILLGKTGAPTREVVLHWNWRAAQELTSRQSIAKSSKLSPRAREALIEIVKIHIKEWAEPESEKELQQIVEATRITFAHVGEGQEVIVAQAAGEKAGCSPTGNCPLWIFKPVKGTYSVLLKGQAQTFTIQPTRTNGLRDIVLSLHDSVAESSLTLYRFNGESYFAGPCFVASWQYLDDKGEVRGLREPRITSCADK